MTLLYIHQYFVFPDTPGATRSYDLATYFAKKGIRVVIITSSSFLEGSFSKRWTVIQRDGIELHVLRSKYSNELSYLQRALVFVGFMLHASLRALRIKCNLVLATSTPITVAVPALIKKLLHHTPFIFEVRDVWPEAPIAIGALKNPVMKAFLHWFEKHIYKRASHIVVLSSDMKRSVQTRTDTPETKLTITPNIANIGRFAQHASSPYLLSQHIGFQPKRSLLYAGTFGTVNGLNALIELAQHTRDLDPELIFILVGWGARKKELVQQASDNQLLNRNIFFVPPIPKNSIPQLYAECTVTSSFVMPIKELWANSANKFFDSLAAGKPVVINYEGWQAELIRRHNLGYVIPYEMSDMKKTAAEFCAYINNTSLLALQSENARNIAAHYSLEVAGEKYVHLIKNLIGLK